MGNLRAPIRVVMAVQGYQWGMLRDCWVERFVQSTHPDFSGPFAEAWAGIHPNGIAYAADIELGTRVPLHQLIAEQGEEILGPELAAKSVVFGGMTFLVKVLSFNPLSIQLHPREADAIRLHEAAKRGAPAGARLAYPDPFEKNEASIALEPTQLLHGFRPPAEIAAELERTPELAALLPQSLRVHPEDPTYLKGLSAELLSSDAAEIARQSGELYARLGRTPSEQLDDRDNWMLQLKPMYPRGDIGLFFFYLLRLLDMRPGQVIAIPAGVPHAYLSGEVVEIMVPSDNVIRCGLTQKAIDRDEFLACMNWDNPSPDPRQGVKSFTCLGGAMVTNAFSHFGFQLNKLSGPSRLEVGSQEGFRLMLNIDGRGDFNWSGRSMPLPKASCFMIPQSLGAYQIEMTSGRLLLLSAC